MEASWNSSQTQADARKATQTGRRRPTDAASVTIASSGDGSFPEITDGAIQLIVEPTNAEREFSFWMEDDWWAEVIQRWADREVTVVIHATPGALLHPIVLHQLIMLRRVVPAWKLIGEAYVSDVSTEQEVKDLAISGYHEVRFFDQMRVGVAAETDRFRSTLSIGELLGRIRAEQAGMGAKTPVLVRLPSRPATNECSVSPGVTAAPPLAASPPTTLSPNPAPQP